MHGYFNNKIIHKCTVCPSSLTQFINIDFKRSEKRPSDRLFVKHIYKDVRAVKQNNRKSCFTFISKDSQYGPHRFKQRQG